MSPFDAPHLIPDSGDGSESSEPVLRWWEPPKTASMVSVKCPRCGAMCTQDDWRCVACRALLGDGPGGCPPVDRGRRAARWALVTLALGAGLGPLVGDGFRLIPKSGGGLDVNLLLWACLGGGCGAVVGYVLGLAGGSRPRPA